LLHKDISEAQRAAGAELQADVLALDLTDYVGRMSSDRSPLDLLAKQR